MDNGVQCDWLSFGLRILSSAIRSDDRCRQWKKNLALDFGFVFVDQSLKAWIASQRIPHRIKS
jgi:hypothetical protein